MILEHETQRIAHRYFEECDREFERDLRSAMTAAELATGTSFNKLRRLVDSIGGRPAAQQLLKEPEHFSYGFRRLRDAKLLAYSVEQLVLNYKATELFTPREIEIAQWRLDHAHWARSLD